MNGMLLNGNMIRNMIRSMLSCARLWRGMMLWGLLLLLVSCDKDPETSAPVVEDPADTTAAPSDSTAVSYPFSFEGYTHFFATQKLPYRVARIGHVQEGGSRLVMYLHGGTSRGEDNNAQLTEPAVDSIAGFLSRTSTPSVLLVPQCPAGESWDSPRMLKALQLLLLSYVDSGCVDQRMVYVLGGSMGGTGTWRLLYAFPRLFAAGMPCAGNPSRASADSIALVPVYTVMGTADQIMSIPTVRGFLAKLDSLKGTYRYDEQEGWTHQQTCMDSYTAARLRWVFSQRISE